MFIFSRIFYVVFVHQTAPSADQGIPLPLCGLSIVTQVAYLILIDSSFQHDSELWAKSNFRYI